MKGFLASPFILALLGLTGCIHSKYYEGPELSRSDTAEIWTYVTGDNPMGLAAIDGRRLRRGRAGVASVLPAKYVVELRTLNTQLVRGDTPGGDKYIGVVTLSFEARSGYSYLFKSAGAWSNLIACVYEDLQNDPKARIRWGGDVRDLGENARKLDCSPAGLQRQ